MGDIIAKNRRIPEENLAQWIQRITECKNSGLTTQEWCTENGIGIKRYYYWHSKIRKKMEAQQSQIYEVPVAAMSEGTPAATIRAGMIQADIYPGADEKMIWSICRALKTC